MYGQSKVVGVPYSFTLRGGHKIEAALNLSVRVPVSHSFCERVSYTYMLVKLFVDPVLEQLPVYVTSLLVTVQLDNSFCVRLDQLLRVYNLNKYVYGYNLATVSRV